MESLQENKLDQLVMRKKDPLRAVLSYATGSSTAATREDDGCALFSVQLSFCISTTKQLGNFQFDRP